MKFIQAIARALAALAKAPFSALDWLLSTGGGGGMPGQSPEFEAVISEADFENHLQTRRSENEFLAHRDAVQTIERYLKAIPSARATCDLSGLSIPTRTALLDMSDAELSALRGAGFSAIRKFVDGRAHGVHGVPQVDNVVALPTPEERLRQRVKLHQMKEENSEAFRAPRQYRR